LSHEHEVGVKWKVKRRWRSSQRRNARGPRFVAQESVHAFLGEELLPAPNTGLGLARAPHDLDGADAIGAEQRDLGAPDMLLSAVAISDQRCQTGAIARRWKASNRRPASPTVLPFRISVINEADAIEIAQPFPTMAASVTTPSLSS
jgi:hypothetical protein